MNSYLEVPICHLLFTFFNFYLGTSVLPISLVGSFCSSLVSSVPSVPPQKCYLRLNLPLPVTTGRIPSQNKLEFEKSEVGEVDDLLKENE